MVGAERGRETGKGGGCGFGKGKGCEREAGGMGPSGVTFLKSRLQDRSEKKLKLRLSCGKEQYP